MLTYCLACDPRPRWEAVNLGFLKLRSRQVEVRGKAVNLEWLEFPDVVGMLPLTDDGRIVLVEQYRVAVDRVTLEIPAGAANPGETQEAAAHRELAEETGYRAAELRRLGAFYPAIGYSSERIALFVATGLTPGPTAFDEGEEIRVVHLSPAEMVAAITGGRICDSKSILAYFLWSGPHLVK